MSRKESNEHVDNLRFMAGSLSLALLVWASSISNGNASPPSADMSNPQTPETTRTTPSSRARYWDVVLSTDGSFTLQDKINMNTKLLDYAVGTMATMYYDNSGGANFDPKADLYQHWKLLKTLAMAHDSAMDRANDDHAYNSNSDGRPFWPTKDQRREAQQQAALYDKTFAFGAPPPEASFGTRRSTVQGLRWLVSTLNDPYSKYLTREQLRQELRASSDDGFLGLGALVEVPSKPSLQKRSATPPYPTPSSLTHGNLLTPTQVANLPKITAVIPHSPAERSGFVVGDSIVAVGSDSFLHRSRNDVAKRLEWKYHADNYVGFPDVTIAKPLALEEPVDGGDGGVKRTKLIGYRTSRVRMPTSSLEPFQVYNPPSLNNNMDSFPVNMAQSTLPQQQQQQQQQQQAPPPLAGGNAICHYQLLTPTDSIFEKAALASSYSFTTPPKESSKVSSPLDDISGKAKTRSMWVMVTQPMDLMRQWSIAAASETPLSFSPAPLFTSTSTSPSAPVGYIRLTRFSKSSTAGFVQAVKALEALGAKSYIIDVRNNYGGVVQEAMLTSSTLLRDIGTVLCYTMNSRGGFTPHDVEEYVTDTRFPGYLLSSEPTTVTSDMVNKIHPSILSLASKTPSSSSTYSKPSSYASFHEYNKNKESSKSSTSNAEQALRKQKKIVVLVNEGTASSAEVFASSLHDNGRTVALVGAKTYGKGLIQHTFPMPDGGGLRLTVAEYLTPALQHVTHVGSARYDPITGDFVGGGVKPDVYCETKGIPSNPGADLCVGIALDVLQDAEAAERGVALERGRGDDVGDGEMVQRVGGGDGSAGGRRVIRAGVVKDDF